MALASKQALQDLLRIGLAMSERGDRTGVHPPKACRVCGQPFWKRSKLTRSQWERQEFCTNACAGRFKRRGQVGQEGRTKIWDGDRIRLRYHVVVEKKIGRPLRPGEIVDHYDGDPTNDDPENLRVFPSTSEHMKSHWREGRMVYQSGYGPMAVHKRKEDKWP